MEKDFIELYEELVYNELGICGCGSPEITVEMIVEYLKHKIEYSKKYKIGKDFEFYKKIYDEDSKWEENFIKENKGALFLFMLYMLNNKGFMEHGSNVYSSWVEEKGEKLIEYYEKVKQYDFEL